MNTATEERDVGLRILDTPNPLYTDQIRSRPCTFCGGNSHSTWQNADNGDVIFICHFCYKEGPKHRKVSKTWSIKKFRIPKLRSRTNKIIVDSAGIALISLAAGMVALPLGLAVGGVAMFALNWRYNE